MSLMEMFLNNSWTIIWSDCLRKRDADEGLTVKQKSRGRKPRLSCLWRLYVSLQATAWAVYGPLLVVLKQAVDNLFRRQVLMPVERVLAALRRRRENYMRHVRLPHGH